MARGLEKALGILIEGSRNYCTVEKDGRYADTVTKICNDQTKMGGRVCASLGRRETLWARGLGTGRTAHPHIRSNRPPNFRPPNPPI